MDHHQLTLFHPDKLLLIQALVLSVPQMLHAQSQLRNVAHSKKLELLKTKTSASAENTVDPSVESTMLHGAYNAGLMPHKVQHQPPQLKLTQPLLSLDLKILSPTMTNGQMLPTYSFHQDTTIKMDGGLWMQTANGLRPTRLPIIDASWITSAFLKTEKRDAVVPGQMETTEDV